MKEPWIKKASRNAFYARVMCAAWSLIQVYFNSCRDEKLVSQAIELNEQLHQILCRHDAILSGVPISTENHVNHGREEEEEAEQLFRRYVLQLGPCFSSLELRYLLVNFSGHVSFVYSSEYFTPPGWLLHLPRFKIFFSSEIFWNWTGYKKEKLVHSQKMKGAV